MRGDPRTSLRRAVLALFCLLALANIYCGRSSDRAGAEGSTVTVLLSSSADEWILSDRGDVFE